MGSFALDMMGLGEAGNLARAAINIADAGSGLFVTQPWGRDHELEADKLGLIIAYLAGFDVSVAPSFWQRFTASGGNDFDFFSTHPSDEKRIAVMRESLDEIYDENDFFSKPLLPETPKAKKKYKNNSNTDIHDIRQINFQQNIQGQQFSNNSSLKCPQCGSQIYAGNNFCNNCGSKLNYNAQCPKCGSEIQFDDNFCMNCGNKLR